MNLSRGSFAAEERRARVPGGHLRWLGAALALLWSFAMLLAAPPAAADDAAVMEFSIPAQPLASALIEFSRQAKVQVLTPGGELQDVGTKGVEGRLTVAAAMERLLAGTGFGYRMVGTDTISLTAPPAKRSEATPANGEVQALEQVVVAGSRIPRTAKESAEEVKVYTAEQISQSGQTTIANFLNTVPEVSTSFTESPFQQNGQSSVTLRGLPFGTTLVLINGRRVQDTGASSHPFFDLNQIPAAAVERIEIVPEGSSAIYGSDALAGVVNIVLKKDFDGAEVDAHYGFASGTDEASTNLAFGHHWSKGSAGVIASYFTRSELTGLERAVTANQDHTADGGPDARVDYCNPGTVYSTDGSNLNGLPSSFAAVPAGSTGKPAVQDFSATAGTTGKCGFWSQYSLLPQSHRTNIMAYGNYELLPWAELFTELMYAHIEQDTRDVNAYLYHQLVPENNIYNPFGEPVYVDYQFDGMRQTSDLNTDFLRPLIGLRGNFGDSWHWEVTAFQSQDRDWIDQANSYVNSANMAAALNSTDPATALNLFGSGAPASQAVLQTLYQPSIQRDIGQADIVNGFLRGSPFSLPGGPVSLVVGGEYTRDKYADSYSQAAGGTEYTFHRDLDSGFAELRVPLIGNKVRPAFGDILAVTAALRYDNYDDFGSHTTPQYGIEWRPVDSLLMRAAYAKAFRAPSLFDLNGPKVSLNGYPVTDPMNGNAVESVLYQAGGSPSLKPETGQSRSVGLVWLPASIKNLQAVLTYWGVDQANRVVSPDAQSVVDFESLFPGRVVRNPDGTIKSVNASYLNFGGLSTSGFDLDLSYRYHTTFGDLSPTASATEVYKFRGQITPGAPVSDRLSKANTDAWAPRWKGTVGLNWKLGPYSANVDGRYVGRYQDYAPLVSGPNGGTYQQLGNFWLYDLHAKYEIGGALAPDNRYLSGLFIAGGVVNLLNSLPPFSMRGSGSPGYDAEQYDIVGRFIYFNVGMKL